MIVNRRTAIKIAVLLLTFVSKCNVIIRSCSLSSISILTTDRRGRDRIVVEFTTPYTIVPITTKVVSSHPVHHVIQHHVIKFANDLQQGGGFLRVLRFPLPIKLTATK